MSEETTQCKGGKTGLSLAIGFVLVSLAPVAIDQQTIAAGALIKPEPVAGALQPNTLCAKDERVIFACLLRRPAKIVSLCASKDLTSETGYVQYRFGLPRKIELEFPKERLRTQENFEYTHYFRPRFELNEIKFTVDGVGYSVFNDYNGEEKPEVTLQGVSINQPGTGKKEVRYNCRTKPKVDYTDLQAALSSH